MLTKIVFELIHAHTADEGQDQAVMGATIALIESVFGRPAALEFVGATSATKAKRKKNQRYYIPKSSYKPLVNKIIEEAGL